MELHKLTYKDVLGMDAKELKETEFKLRAEVNFSRLDVYKIKGNKKPRRELRKSLARVLTAKRQLAVKAAGSK